MVIITREHHAFDPKRAAERALRAVKEGVAVSVNGKDVQVRADCICVHSDTPNAIDSCASRQNRGRGLSRLEPTLQEGDCKNGAA